MDSNYQRNYMLRKKKKIYLPPYILLHEFKVFNGPAVSNRIISQGLKYSQ